MKLNLLLIFLIPFFSISQTKIGNDIEGAYANDLSGWSTSLSSDGSIVAIGAIYNGSTTSNTKERGLCAVYEYKSGVWSQIGENIYGEAAYDISGWSVSLSSDGSIVAIGAPHNDNGNGNTYNSGHVRVYKNNSGTWKKLGNDIDAKTAGDLSGWSVSLSSDGSMVAIGATAKTDNSDNSGYVHVYKYKSGAWTQVGDNINGEAAGDQFGHSVSLSSDGSILAIGAPYNEGNGPKSGHVQIYKNTSSGWEQLGNIIKAKKAGDLSGWSVSLSPDGSTVAIGATAKTDNNDNSGYVHVYKYESGSWIQIGNDIYGEAEGDEFGYSVSLSSNSSILAIGAPYNEGNGPKSGHVRIYKNTSSGWKQLGSDIDSEKRNDRSGYSVSLSPNGSMIAIGAPYNNSNIALYTGQVRVYDLRPILSSDTFVLSQFGVLPNPAKNQTTIKLNKGLTLKKVNIYNGLGQFILATQKKVINTSGLSTGLYYVEVLTNKGKATKKLVVK